MRYYTLIAGLRDLSPDETRVAEGVREEIAEALTPRDGKVAALLDEWDEIAKIEDPAEKSEKFEDYYKRCAKSKSKFLRKWSEFDKNLREDIASGKLPEMERTNFIERERAIDNLRWTKADELLESGYFAGADYFGPDSVLAYLVKLKMVERWAKLDPATGREMYGRLLAQLKMEN